MSPVNAGSAQALAARLGAPPGLEHLSPRKAPFAGGVPEQASAAQLRHASAQHCASLFRPAWGCQPGAQPNASDRLLAATSMARAALQALEETNAPMALQPCGSQASRIQAATHSARAALEALATFGESRDAGVCLQADADSASATGSLASEATTVSAITASSTDEDDLPRRRGSRGHGCRNADASSATFTTLPIQFSQAFLDFERCKERQARALEEPTTVELDEGTKTFRSYFAHSAELDEGIRTIRSMPERPRLKRKEPIEPPLSWPASATTVMIRNVPNRYVAEELLHEFVEDGFMQSIDFFYLPCDFDSKFNRGFAFVNLMSTEAAERFRSFYHGSQLPRYSTKKYLEITPAVQNGFAANVRKHVKANRGARLVNPWFVPMVFLPTETGVPLCVPLNERPLPEWIERHMRDCDAAKVKDQVASFLSLKNITPPPGLRRGGCKQ